MTKSLAAILVICIVFLCILSYKMGERDGSRNGYKSIAEECVDSLRDAVGILVRCKPEVTACLTKGDTEI